MTRQLKLETLAQRLKDKLSRAMLPGRLYLDEREMKEVIEALDVNTINEVTLEAVLFGDDATAGKQWAQIIAEIRRLKAELSRANSFREEVDRSTDSIESSVDRLSIHNGKLLKALEHLDAIIADYNKPGLSFINTIKSAAAWRNSIKE